MFSINNIDTCLLFFGFLPYFLGISNCIIIKIVLKLFYRSKAVYTYKEGKL